jgi:hypothetical protein
MIRPITISNKKTWFELPLRNEKPLASVTEVKQSNETRSVEIYKLQLLKLQNLNINGNSEMCVYTCTWERQGQRFDE